ncbi:hypothetical protein C8R45DRAFT_958322 [Mycena sanguinolenta]|nr:hypothetical protein C8R45DRAFT_958322 [Mycena sanguinolenta]
MSRLYLKNLPSQTSRDDIVKYLERFGKLTELKILKSAFGTCGFAQYDSAQDARFVLKTFRDQLFLGHRIVVELARPLRKDLPHLESHPSGRKTMPMEPKYHSNRAPCRYPVLVADIPRHICRQELKDFGRLAGGAVAFCDLDPTRDGRGFIEYFSREDAEEAVEMLNGQKLGGGVVRVSTYSSAARRRSRSRSPIRRPRCQVPDLPETKSEEPSHTFSFPTSASRYSITQAWSSEIPSQRFTSGSYSDDSALCTAAIGSHRETVTRGKPMVQTSTSSTDSTLPVAAAHDCYDFDAYLRLSYDRHLNGICVGTGFVHDSNKLERNAVYIPGFIHSEHRSDSFPSFQARH